MTDFVSTAIKLQQEMLRAQRAQLDLAQQMLDAGAKAVATQADAKKALDANTRAWKSWAALWGWK